MSDFDRNVAAARGGYADRAVAYDAGLRAHMIRVYNYMASAVALTATIPLPPGGRHRLRVRFDQRLRYQDHTLALLTWQRNGAIA